MNEWLICQFSNGKYIGVDSEGGFTYVDDINKAYLAVESELDDSAEVMKGELDYRFIKCVKNGDEIKIIH